MAFFLTLPIELQRAVISACDARTKAGLAQCSHVISRIAVEELYTIVDLSSHNSEQKCVRDYGYDDLEEVPADFTDRNSSTLDEIVFHKQKLFMETLEKTPGYGEHVRELYWTIIDPVNRFGRPTNQGLFVTQNTNLQSIEYYCPSDERLWSTFQKFCKVKKVDIAFIREWRETCQPPPLFQSAQSVRLVGIMTRSLVSRILDDPRRLKNLALHNLKVFGDPIPKLPANLSFLEAMEFVTYNYEGYSGSGAAIGILQPFISQFSVLESVRFGMIGALVSTNESKESQGIERYKEIANFLKSVRPTLRTLYFEQGLDTGFQRVGRSRGLCFGRPLGPDSSRPPYSEFDMDRIFAAVLFPAILETHWPQLRDIEIRGAGRWTQYVFAHLDAPPFPKQVVEADPVFNLTGPLYKMERIAETPHDSWYGFTEVAKAAIRKRLGPHVSRFVLEEEALRGYDWDEGTGILDLWDPE